jgi:hypothetical protein
LVLRRRTRKEKLPKIVVYISCSAGRTLFNLTNINDATAVLNPELVPREDGMYLDDNQCTAVGRKICLAFFLEVRVTCNQKCPEIKEQLKKGQTAQDRPNINARVFKLKKDQIMQDLKSGHVLGKIVAHMHVVEFLNRGLPHAHI